MKKLTLIINAQVVTEAGIIWDGAILIKDGKICKIAKTNEIEISEDMVVIDAEGLYVGPGFVDIHVHGFDTYDSCFNMEEFSEHFLRHGETTVLATPLYTMNFDTLINAIECAKTKLSSTKNIKGFYLEGPFINAKYGSNYDKNPWRNGITEEQYTKFVDAAGEFAKVWTIAPEREDIMPFLEYAKKVNPNTKFAVGHSEATPDEIRALGKYKPTIQTHSMNATGRKSVPGGTRGYGPDEYSFKEPDVYCELISDSCGLHVNSDMQQLLIHTKGVHRVALITDSTMTDNENPPHLSYIADLNFDHNGDIAGSKLTMDKACKNIMQHTFCGITQAFIMASLNPAKAIGMGDEIGSIEIGKNADLVIVDDKFNVKNVFVNGELCF